MSAYRRRTPTVVLLMIFVGIVCLPIPAAWASPADIKIHQQVTQIPAQPCVGPNCIPQPTPPSHDVPESANSEQPASEPECDLFSPSTWMGCLFGNLVLDALDPLFEFLGKAPLTTPELNTLPGVSELWTSSWHILVASYTTLVLIAGLVVMSYGSLQSRYSMKEIAPRVAMGFVAGTLSLFLATKAIEIANALSLSVMGDGANTTSAAKALRDMIVFSANDHGMFVFLIGFVVAAMIVALLVTYVVRVIVTILLVVGAPLALMLHALPHTEGVARKWWTALGGCLTIQIGQSLVLIAAMKVFLSPDGFPIFGSGTRTNELVALLFVVALLYILIKIPFWALAPIRDGHHRSAALSISRGVQTVKKLGTSATSFGRLSQPRQTGLATPTARQSANRRPQKPSAASPGSQVATSSIAHEHARNRKTRGDHSGQKQPLGRQLSLWSISDHNGQQRLRVTPAARPLRSSPTRRLAEELNDPKRVLPYHKPAAPHNPALLTPSGHINPAAVARQQSSAHRFMSSAPSDLSTRISRPGTQRRSPSHPLRPHPHGKGEQR